MAVWNRGLDSTHELNDKIYDCLLLCDQKRSMHDIRSRAYEVFRLCLSDIKLGHVNQELKPSTIRRMIRREQTP